MRIRTIKPEFWTDKRVASWDHFTRLLFIGLWSAADDHGRGSAESARLASELFPYDLSRDPSETLARVAAGLDTLAAAYRITLYDVEGEAFYEVSSWSRHQRVDNAGKPRVPTPSQGVARVSRELPRVAAGTGSREQGAGKGSEEREVAARQSSSWPKLSEVKAVASMRAIPESVAEDFWNHFEAQGWQTKDGLPIVSWQSKFSTWWVNEQAKAQKAKMAGSGSTNGRRQPLPATPDDAGF